MLMIHLSIIIHFAAFICICICHGEGVAVQPLSEISCKPGFYCTGPSAVPVLCGGEEWYCPKDSLDRHLVPQGFYSIGGTKTSRTEILECEPGYYCQNGVKHLCPARTFGNVTGLFSSQCSGLCPEGHVCPSAGMVQPIPCGGPSLFCPAGSKTRTQVSIGFISINGSPETRSSQAMAPAGTYALNGELHLCPAGRFGSQEGTSTSLCEGLCEIGYYCHEGSDNPRQFVCGADNVYCPEGSVKPLLVDEGFYVSTVEEPCPPGRWRNSSNVGNSSICQACPSGTFKLNQGDHPALCIQCPRYITESTSDRTSCKCLPQDVNANYSLIFDPALIKCARRPTWSFSALNLGIPEIYKEVFERVSVTSFMLPNTQFSRGLQVQCEAGYYCQNGKRFPCPPGTVGRKIKESSALCEGKCPPGHYCDGKGSLPRKCGHISLFCPEGTAIPTLVQDGFETYNSWIPYSLETSEQNTIALTEIRDAERPCPPGFYCEGGKRIPCEAGKYGAIHGLSRSYCSGDCDGGYYCPQGSTSSMQNDCGNVTVYCPPGSKQPRKIEEGYYSVYSAIDKLNKQYERLSRNKANMSFQRKCGSGFYCIEGLKIPCPRGYFAIEGVTGASSKMEACRVCGKGFTCPESPTYEPKECQKANTYCPVGSVHPKMVKLGYYSSMEESTSVNYTSIVTRTKEDICPIGHYCVDGVKFSCSAGRFGNQEGLYLASCSGFCPAGHFCPQDGTSTPIPCPANHFAPPGMKWCMNCGEDILASCQTSRNCCLVSQTETSG